MRHRLPGLMLAMALLGIPGVRAADVVNLEGPAAQEALAGYRQILAQQPQDEEALKNAGILLHQLSRVQPTKEGVEEGEKYLREAQKQHPQDPEIAAWLGSIITMKAIFETDPGKQTFYVKQGTRMMDQAVQQNPDNRMLRLVRGYNSMELPVFLKRTRYAVEDLSYYLDLCAKQPDCPTGQVTLAEQRLAQARRIVAEQN